MQLHTLLIAKFALVPVEKDKETQSDSHDTKVAEQKTIQHGNAACTCPGHDKRKRACRINFFVDQPIGNEWKRRVCPRNSAGASHRMLSAGFQTDVFWCVDGKREWHWTVTWQSKSSETTLYFAKLACYQERGCKMRERRAKGQRLEYTWRHHSAEEWQLSGRSYTTGRTHLRREDRMERDSKATDDG